MIEDDFVPSKEFIDELEALCRKYKIALIGSDYNDAVWASPHDWTSDTHIKIDVDTFGCSHLEVTDEKVLT